VHCDTVTVWRALGAPFARSGLIDRVSSPMRSISAFIKKSRAPGAPSRAASIHVAVHSEVPHPDHG
jgi:hypothetical protein